MGRNYFLILLLLLAALAAGCPVEQESEPATPPSPKVAPSPEPAQPALSPPIEGHGKEKNGVLVDDFDLPLQIELEAPKVPDALLRPSPPIKEPAGQGADEGKHS